MRKLSFFYFIPHDLKRVFDKHKRESLLCLIPILLGIIVGVLLAQNAQSEYTGVFVLILSGEFSPFKSMRIYIVILLGCVAISYLCACKKPFVLLLLSFLFFTGYIFGRISFFTVQDSVLWGIVSLIFFVIPNLLIILFVSWLSFSLMQEHVLSGLSPIRNSKESILCLKIFGVGCAALFVINVILGSFINLLVNIV